MEKSTLTVLAHIIQLEGTRVYRGPRHPRGRSAAASDIRLSPQKKPSFPLTHGVDNCQELFFEAKQMPDTSWPGLQRLGLTSTFHLLAPPSLAPLPATSTPITSTPFEALYHGILPLSTTQMPADLIIDGLYDHTNRGVRVYLHISFIGIYRVLGIHTLLLCVTRGKIIYWKKSLPRARIGEAIASSWMQLASVNEP